jgi:cytoskeletal protein RodZ
MDKKMFRKYFSSLLLALAAVCFLLAIVSFLVADKSTSTQKTVVQKEKSVVTVKQPETVSVTPTQQTIQAKKIVTPTPVIPTATPTQAQNSVVLAPTATPTPVPQGLQVSLTINGSSVGTVNVSAGANQCDILSQALSQGKIQSLNMSYDSGLGTYGVYQINGVGKDNAVWWVYKVNGQSPNQGCSFIKVNNGDNAAWSYLGN